MSGVDDIREQFLGYFRKNDHEIVPSAPLVPRNDPTLMFTNAGMVPFKNVFTGVERRSYVRAVSSQKCVRAGGKHNDLDNVGYTARHHTFFEMLGNFSFGDYFKDRAIPLAWDLLTRDYGLSPERLVITVFSEDEEAASIWRKVTGFSDSRIIRISTSDNFWSMGETGPCGPCSEIFYDHGAGIQGGPPGSADADGDRFVEIWNLVFMQYEQLSVEQRVDLPRPSIDTGMGLERIAAVLQGVHDNYDIDLFRRLIRASVDLTGVPAEGENRASHRIIADHLRASSFLIADGVLPSNEGRGYVLRRFMRRAMRHAHLLGAADPLMHRLAPTLIAEMGAAYPELHRAETLIRETLRLEETRFRKTLERGLSLLAEASSSLGPGDVLPGDVAFKLYDTYGFPVDLTEDALKARGVGLDQRGFEAAMRRQKEEARKAWSGSGDAATERLWFELRDRSGPTEFLGYTTEEAEGTIVAILADGQEVDRLKAGQEGALVVNQTPFYAESGGQVGDRGMIESAGMRFTVVDTQKKLGDLFVHLGKLEKGELKTGDTVKLSVNHARRTLTRANHSATHLLHEALRQTLGTHVAQKGSLVDPDRLRFDFSHQKAMSAEELASVAGLANETVVENASVETRVMAVDDAIATGALALFGEKYGDEVRVVAMGGRPAPARDAWSVELCGGTHVARTGDIGAIAVTSESAVGAGVRRIEALTGQAALAHLSAHDQALRDTASVLKTTPENVPQRVAALVEERRNLERQLADARKKLAMGGGAQDEAQDIRDLGAVKFIGRKVEGVAPKDLRGLVDDGKKRLGSGVVAIVGVTGEGKAGLVVGVTSDLVATIDAVVLAKVGAEAIGGTGGGGRPDMAQAGGPDGARAQEAIEAIAREIASARA